MIKIKKRNGDIADFDKVRIINAITKASQSVEESSITQIQIESITDFVLEDLQKQFDGLETIPSVEQVQDLVEKQLVESGNFEIAKHYILYRAERARARAEKRLEELQKLEKNLLKVIKSSGKSEVFNISKIKKVIARAGNDFSFVDQDRILQEVKRNVFDGITTKDISKAIVMAGKAYIERGVEYSYFTARLLLDSIYREVFNTKFNEKNFAQKYKSSFVDNLEKSVEAERINPELLTFNLETICEALDPKRDHELNYLGLQTLYDRYFIHIKGQRMEAPQHFWMRVAMGLALGEAKENRETRAIEFYNVLSTLRFISSTPTLFNAGTTHSQLSSCYLSTITDSLEHIFKVISDNAQLSKWAGGIGNDWTSVRATSSPIKGTNGRSQGVIPFLKIANDTAVAVNQGGKRKGAVCAYLECWHFDFPEFLELRKNTGDDRRRTHDMNTAAWIPDLFMKRLQSGGNWTLFSPCDCPDLHDLYGEAFEKAYTEYEQKTETGEITLFKTMPAAELWRKMVTMLFETGHPWMTFKDPCNVRSPQDHCGVVHDSNLCTEITLNNSKDETAVCNLGSLNLAKHFNTKTGVLDKEMLAESIKTGMRMLDNVIDINFYPTQETRSSNMKHRPVGLGLMGLADLFYLAGYDFGSEAAVDYSDEVMEFISYNAILGSSLLAKERGAYKSYEGSKWSRNILPNDTVEMLEKERGETTNVKKGGKMDWTPVREHIKQYGMRNSNTMAIAPTATISNIAGCIPCTEPIYKNLYVKSNMGGEFTVINPHLVRDLKAMNLWGEAMIQQLKIHDGSIQALQEIPITLREKYKEVFEISPMWVIKHAAVRNKWLDQSQSTNLFYRGTSGKEISEIYKAAWKAGIKTTYYLRTLGASQVEKSTVQAKGTHVRDFSKSSMHDGSTADQIHNATNPPLRHSAVNSSIAKAPSQDQPVAPSMGHSMPTELPSSGLTPASAVASASALLDDVGCESCQ